MQHDVQEFNRVLQDKLESKMKVGFCSLSLIETFLDAGSPVPRGLKPRALSSGSLLAR